MKKTVGISISGVGFTLTTTGYSELKGYLDRLRSGYAKSPDGVEIVADIEARIVELILSKESSDGVISDSTISEIIEQLGYPEEISDEFKGGVSAKGEGDEQEGRFPRRLYRDGEGAMLGGVCSGFARFLDIDPTMVRLSMFVPLLALIILPSIGFHFLNGFLGAVFGATILLYFVMWLVVPQARSPRQRLEMRGEKITVLSIGEDSKSRMDEHQGEETTSIFTQIFIILGRIMLFFIKVAAILVGFSIVACVIGMLFAIGMVLFASSDVVMNSIHLPFILPEIGILSIRLLVTLIILAALLPLAIIAYQAIRIAFGLRNSAVAMWTICGLWFIVLVALSVVTINNYQEIKQSVKSGRIYERAIESIIPKEISGVVVINGDTILHAKKEGYDREVDVKQLLRSLDMEDGNKKIEINTDKGSITITVKEGGDSTSVSIKNRDLEQD